LRPGLTEKNWRKYVIDGTGIDTDPGQPQRSDREGRASREDDQAGDARHGESALADQHLLEKKLKENEDKIADWNRKAELAVAKKQDDLARAAIERSLQYKQMSASFGQQVADQKAQTDTLKTMLSQLQHKLAEARSKSEMLIAQHRRARVASKAAEAKARAGDPIHESAFDRLKNKVMHTEAVGEATDHVTRTQSIEDRLAQLEKEDEINRILGELKSAQKG
jgi:phage shock protein A